MGLCRFSCASLCLTCRETYCKSSPSARSYRWTVIRSQKAATVLSLLRLRFGNVGSLGNRFCRSSNLAVSPAQGADTLCRERAVLRGRDGILGMYAKLFRGSKMRLGKRCNVRLMLFQWLASIHLFQAATAGHANVHWKYGKAVESAQGAYEVRVGRDCKISSVRAFHSPISSCLVQDMGFWDLGNARQPPA